MLTVFFVFLNTLLARLADSVFNRLDEWRYRLRDVTITPAMTGAAIVLCCVVSLVECAALVWILSNL